MTSNLDLASPGRSFRQRLGVFVFGVILLGAVLALVWQVKQRRRLREENIELSSATAYWKGLDEQSNKGLERGMAAAAADSSLQQQLAELGQLRAAVAILRSNLAGLPALRAEAQRLESERAEAAARAGVVEEDPFKAARERAERAACVNNLKQVGLAARLYSLENKDFLPPDFLTMSNELNTPKVLTCPGDTARKPVVSWGAFDGSSVSYEFLSPSVKEGLATDIVMTRCPLHYCVGLLDGSVQQLGRTTHVVVIVDGHHRIVRKPSATPP